MLPTFCNKYKINCLLFLDSIKNNRKIHTKLLVWLIHITLLSGLLLFTLYSYRCRFHSDAATAGMIGLVQHSISGLLVENWAYSQDFWPMFILNSVYFLDGIISSVFTRTQIFIAIQDIFIYVLSVLILNKITTKFSAVICMLFLFSGVSTVWSEFFFGQGQYGNVLLLLLLQVYSISIVIEKNNVMSWGSVVLFLTVLISNSTSIRYIPFFLVPALSALIVSQTAYRQRARTIKFLLVLVFISSGLGLSIFYYLKHRFMFLEGVNASVIVSYQNFINFNLKNSIEGLMILFADEASGFKFTSIQSAIFFLRLSVGFFIIFFGVRGISLIINQRKDESGIFLYFLSIFTSFLAGICILSVLFMSSAENRIASARYLMIPSYFLTMLCACSYSCMTRNVKKVATCSVVVLAVVNVFFYYINPLGASNKFDPVIAALKENHLTQGYATYWNSDVITVLSDYSVKVYHIKFDKVLPFYFMSSKSFYESTGVADNFLILHESELNIFDLSTLSDYVGKPVNKIVVNDYHIYVYKANFPAAVPGWDSQLKNF